MRSTRRCLLCIPPACIHSRGAGSRSDLNSAVHLHRHATLPPRISGRFRHAPSPARPAADHLRWCAGGQLASPQFSPTPLPRHLARCKARSRRTAPTAAHFFSLTCKSFWRSATWIAHGPPAVMLSPGGWAGLKCRCDISDHYPDAATAALQVVESGRLPELTLELYNKAVREARSILHCCAL